MRHTNDAISEGLGRAKPHGKASLHEAHVRRAAGGYIVRHHEYKHKDGQTAHEHPMAGSEHVATSMEDVHKHLDEHMGDGGAGEEKAEGAEEAAGERDE